MSDVAARIDAIVDFAAGEYLFGPVYCYDLTRYVYPHKMRITWRPKALIWAGICNDWDCYTYVGADNFANALGLALAHTEQYKVARR